MKKPLLLAAVAALSLLLASPGRAASIGTDLLPAVQLTADGSVVPVDTKLERLSDTAFRATFNASTDDLLVAGVVEFDADPFVEYSLAVKSFLDAPLTFSFTFTTPFIDGPWGVLQSSHSSSATDGKTSQSPLNGSVTVGLAAGQSFVHVPLIDGADVAAGGISTGCALSGPNGFSDGCAGFSNVVTGVSPTDATGTLGARVAFELSKTDLYSANGRVELLPIPEPGTLLLVGAGALSLALARRS